MRPVFLLLMLGAVLATACSDPSPTGKTSGAATGDSQSGGFEVFPDFETIAGPKDVPVAVDGDAIEPAGEVTGTAPIVGQFGAPCEKNEECDSGLCVPGPSGQVCTKTCENDCPVGYQCKAKTSSSGDITYLCVPGFTDLCNPCQKAGDCNELNEVGNLCVSYGNDGSFCGVACGAGKLACPNGYDCGTVIDADTGKQDKQCQPKKGVCTCSSVAIAKTAQTTCVNKNTFGACTGLRTCTAGGLTDCAAPVPKAEECNGLDDDCNGKTDDFDVTAKCFSKPNDFGKCPGILTSCTEGAAVCNAPDAKPETCNGLDDDCDGETDNTTVCNDDNVCTQDACNTGGGCKNSPITGPKCDDGNVCTEQDQCSQGSCQGTKPLDCDDGDPCTLDGCGAVGGCVHTPQDAKCTDDGIACTLDVCVGGKCSHPATSEGGPCPDDGNSCSQDLCKAGKCEHPPVADGAQCLGDSNECGQSVCQVGACKVLSIKDNSPCLDDGNPCTGDVCGGGKCTHPPVAFTVGCADDGNQCTADVCDKGGCTHQSLGAEKTCLDEGDPCTQDVCLTGACSHPPASNNSVCADDGKLCTNDICQGGKCTHPQVDGKACVDDGLPCTTDVCNGGACSHPAIVGNVPCEDDGKACTKDVCQGGLCKHVNQTAPCDDSDPCTLTDTCDSASGSCKGFNKPNCDDKNDCTVDSCTPGVGCVHSSAVGNFCDDGNVCTANDKCSNGKCIGTASKNCDDGNPCTTDGCDTNCTHVNNTQGCTDDNNPCTTDACSNGACAHASIANGLACDNKDNNPCADGLCQSGVCKSAFNDKVCNDGNACTSNDKCVNGTCEGSAFKDCNDGNPCTTDSCDKYGTCTHAAGSGGQCVAPSGDCPAGTCNGGVCLSTSGATCQAKIDVDLCSSVKVPGTCSGNGKCVASSAPPQYQCPGCNGICVKCLFLQFCVPF